MTFFRVFVTRGVTESPSKISSLERLHLYNCLEIGSLPEEGLPRGLKELYIKHCPPIKQRCQEGGPYRGKIAHIRDIEVDG
jgi:hypothetical protein